MHPLGDTGLVSVPHLLRVRYLSRNSLPSAVFTKSSLLPWNAMMGMGSETFSVKGMTPTLPEQGAVARNTLKTYGSVYDIIPPKLKPVEKIRSWSMHKPSLSFLSMASKNFMSASSLFHQPLPLASPLLPFTPLGATKMV